MCKFVCARASVRECMRACHATFLLASSPSFSDCCNSSMGRVQKSKNAMAVAILLVVACAQPSGTLTRPALGPTPIAHESLRAEPAHQPPPAPSRWCACAFTSRSSPWPPASSSVCLRSAVIYVSTPRMCRQSITCPLPF
jgi:hypothetical protein